MPGRGRGSGGGGGGRGSHGGDGGGAGPTPTGEGKEAVRERANRDRFLEGMLSITGSQIEVERGDGQVFKGLFHTISRFVSCHPPPPPEAHSCCDPHFCSLPPFPAWRTPNPLSCSRPPRCASGETGPLCREEQNPPAPPPRMRARQRNHALSPTARPARALRQNEAEDLFGYTTLLMGGNDVVQVVYLGCQGRDTPPRAPLSRPLRTPAQSQATAYRHHRRHHHDHCHQHHFLLVKIKIPSIVLREQLPAGAGSFATDTDISGKSAEHLAGRDLTAVSSAWLDKDLASDSLESSKSNGEKVNLVGTVARHISVPAIAASRLTFRMCVPHPSPFRSGISSKQTRRSPAAPPPTTRASTRRRSTSRRSPGK